MSAEEEYWDHLIRGLRNGDRNVVYDFCQRDGASLERLAAKHLPAGLRLTATGSTISGHVCAIQARISASPARWFSFNVDGDASLLDLGDLIAELETVQL